MNEDPTTRKVIPAAIARAINSNTIAIVGSVINVSFAIATRVLVSSKLRTVEGT